MGRNPVEDLRVLHGDPQCAVDFLLHPSRSEKVRRSAHPIGMRILISRLGKGLGKLRKRTYPLYFHSRCSLGAFRLRSRKGTVPWRRVWLDKALSARTSAFCILPVRTPARSVCSGRLRVLSSAIGAPRINRLQVRFVLSRQRSPVWLAFPTRNWSVQNNAHLSIPSRYPGRSVSRSKRRWEAGNQCDQSVANDPQ